MPHSPIPRSTLFFHEGAGGWCLPFLGSDKSVAERSQYAAAKALTNYTPVPAHPSQLELVEGGAEGAGFEQVEVRTYMAFSSWLMAVGVAAWGVLFALLASFGPTRRLLEAAPGLFSFGMFSKEGPTRAQVQPPLLTGWKAEGCWLEMAGTRFKYSLFGRGWNDVVWHDASKSAPDRRLRLDVEGPDPGYTATAAFLVAAALTIREEGDKMPGRWAPRPLGAGKGRGSGV